MTRETEEALLNFCAQQQAFFDEAAWLETSHPNQDEFLATVLFLAGVDWYGHRANLVSVANALEPEAIGNLSKIARRTGFDLSRFSTMLRRKLNHESIVRAS